MVIQLIQKKNYNTFHFLLNLFSATKEKYLHEYSNNNSKNNNNQKKLFIYSVRLCVLCKPHTYMNMPDSYFIMVVINCLIKIQCRCLNAVRVHKPNPLQIQSFYFFIRYFKVNYIFKIRKKQIMIYWFGL